MNSSRKGSTDYSGIRTTLSSAASGFWEADISSEKFSTLSVESWLLAKFNSMIIPIEKAVLMTLLICKLLAALWKLMKFAKFWPYNIFHRKDILT